MEQIIENSRYIKELFAPCKDREQIYQTIINIGKKLPTTPPAFCSENNRVYGCQSKVYLQTTLCDNHLFLKAYSDALISSGLAYLVIRLYSGLSPESILKSSPAIFEELQIVQSLSLNRSNGLQQMLLHVKKEAVAAISKKFNS